MLIFGHRGSMGYRPENTISSFELAISQKADGIELDVRNDKNKIPVVFHDVGLDRLTGIKVKVQDKSFAELRKIKVRFPDEQEGTVSNSTIPSLEDVLNFVDKKIIVNVELKGPNTAKSVCEVAKKFIKKRKLGYANLLISSFNFKELEKIKKLDSKLRTGFLFSKSPVKNLKLAIESNVYSANVRHTVADKKLISKAHENNLKVFVWTVNDQKRAKRLNSMGVDGIFTNYPDKMREWVK